MNYTKRHYDKLAKLITDADVRITEKPNKHFYEESWSNCFFLHGQTITLGTKSPWWITIATLAHEFGHCLSVREGGGCSQGDMMNYRFGVIVNHTHAKRLIEEERRAWRFGFKFMRDNSIPVDAKMINARRVLVKKGHKKLWEAL